VAHQVTAAEMKAEEKAMATVAGLVKAKAAAAEEEE